MNNKYKLLSLFIVIVILITSLSLTSSAVDAIGSDNVFLFGSYPQSEVRDSELLSALNSTEFQWKSYDYYCGTGKWNDGKCIHLIICNMPM